jgi:hypothetical protein
MTPKPGIARVAAQATARRRPRRAAAFWCRPGGLAGMEVPFRLVSGGMVHCRFSSSRLLPYPYGRANCPAALPSKPAQPASLTVRDLAGQLDAWLDGVFRIWRHIPGGNRQAEPDPGSAAVDRGMADVAPAWKRAGLRRYRGQPGLEPGLGSRSALPPLPRRRLCSERAPRQGRPDGRRFAMASPALTRRPLALDSRLSGSGGEVRGLGTGCLGLVFAV